MFAVKKKLMKECIVINGARKAPSEFSAVSQRRVIARYRIGAYV